MKQIIAVLLAVVLLAGLLTACGKNSNSDSAAANAAAESTQSAENALRLDPIDKAAVKTVAVLDSLYSSYIHNITDEDAVAELVELYNGLTYEPLSDGEEAPDVLTGTLYMLTYYREPLDGAIFGDPVAAVNISPQGYIMPDDGVNMFENVYRLTSSFDEERLREILTQYDANPSFDGMEYTGGN